MSTDEALELKEGDLVLIGADILPNAPQDIYDAIGKIYTVQTIDWEGSKLVISVKELAFCFYAQEIESVLYASD